MIFNFLILPKQLASSIDDGTDIAATVSIANRITLKINNRLYKNQ